MRVSKSLQPMSNDSHSLEESIFFTSTCYTLSCSTNPPKIPQFVQMQEFRPSSSGLGPIAPTMIEPTPINNTGVIEAVPSLITLPTDLRQYCDEYIAALSHLVVPQHGLGGSSSQQDVSMPRRIQASSPVVLPAPTLSAPDTTWGLPTTEEVASGSVVSLGSSSARNTSGGVDPNSTKVHAYQQERWIERYHDLVAFRQRYGHCNVPYVYKENPCLGQWVKRQRHQYKLYKQEQHSNLDSSRVHALTALGFIWDSHGAAWEENFEELKEFHRIHGHANVPCSHRGSSKLSTWIKRQRRQYRLFRVGDHSTIDQERIERLEALDFVWDYYGKSGA